MTFFRSEDHVRNWSGFDPAAEDGIISLESLVTLFSKSFFRRRMDEDYLSKMPTYGPEFMGAFQEIGKTGPFWALGG